MAQKLTPATLFNKRRSEAVELRTRLMRVRRQQKNLEAAIARKEEEALGIVLKAVGLEPLGLGVDEFGNYYRVTKISAPNLGWSYYGAGKSKYGVVLNQLVIHGVLLNAKGQPAWKEPRQLRVKLKAVEMVDGQPN